MDGSDEDEDVMFEHSPLYQSLREAGLTDADVHVHKETPVQHARTIHTEDVHQIWRSPLLSLRGLIMAVLGLTMLAEDIERLTNVNKAEVFKLILQSKLMTEEDRDCLSTSLSVPDTPTYRLTLRPKFLVTLSLPCLLAYLYGRVVYPEMPWKYRSLTDVTAGLCLCYMVAVISRLAVLYRHQLRLSRASQHVHQLVSCCEGLLRFTSRALRLVQEAELVARGFTLVSQQSPVSRLEQNSLHSTQRQCPRLRACLFLAARKAMLVAKDKTVELIDLYPLGGDIDGALNYLAQVPVGEYGPCVQTDGEDEEGRSHLYNITDGFSVASLKGIKHLCDLHISELFRRLTFTLCYSGEVSLRPETTGVETLMTSIHTPMLEERQRLQQMYNSHSCLIEEKATQTPKYAPPNDAHPLRETYMAVHSLDLHLQAAWLRVRSLSSLLETHLDQSGGSPLDDGVGSHNDQLRLDDAYDKLRLQVKHELHACKACWEEGISRLEKLEKVKANQPVDPLKRDVSPQEVQSDGPPIPLFDMGDPIIEDQVFEAYITEDPVESYYNDWDEFITPEEKAKKKKEKQEAMRLLMELKSVISVRATEREIRENKALEKSRSQSNGTLSGNGAEPCSSSGDGALPEAVPRNGEVTQSAQTPENQEVPVSVPCKRQSCGDCDSNSADKLCNCTESSRLQTCGHLKDSHSTEDSVNEHKQTLCDYQLKSGGCNQEEYARKRTKDCVRNGSVEESEDSEDKHFSTRYNQRKVRLPEYTDSESEGDEELVKDWCGVIQSKRVSHTTEDESDICDNGNDSNYGPPLIRDQETLAERMARLSGANMSFSANLAAMAAARSRDMGLSEATFGDEDDSDEADDATED
ncbi:vezatin-like [Mizuhopecten yessoensis]|uniref:Vezatin n=1 Tax=Mizuhopecten yessoensis TaxID=6573 RepID=A0A210QWZ2_MIZYE|nr:vezatin-like [Mizuhopecten yessoensis]OWF53233.1 Vezatin [Mizuhopecten yessoensis]